MRGERDPRIRIGQATEPVRTRGCRVDKNEAGGCVTRRTSPGVPIRRVATSGDRRALSGDVSRLWCSGRQHATCAFVSPCRHASNPTPAVGPRDSHPLKRMSVCDQVESGASFNADRDSCIDIIIERGGSETRRHRTSNAKACSSTSPTRIPKRGFTCGSQGLTLDETPISAFEARKRNHYARPGHVSFDERSQKLTIAG